MSCSEDLPLSDPVIEAYKKDIDRSLLRENLKLTVEQRFLKWIAHHGLNEELRRAGREARKGKWSTSKGS